MKNYLLLGVLSLIMVGCSAAPKKIELTQAEISQLGKDKNKGAEILVRKALLKDMSEYKYSEEESKALKEAKENLEIEFYLEHIAAQRASISDEEVIALYNANKENLKDMKAEVALPQIKEQLYLQRLNAEKINYINSLVEKYQLNEKFKSYFPNGVMEEVKAN